MPGIKYKYLLMAALLLYPAKSYSIEKITITPDNRASLQNTRTYSGVVMNAYQKVYAMNFEIWKPSDLPAGWYATFDGFPVAQIAENRWVYGQLNIEGQIMPTNILVGSVVPSSVPGITRIAAVWSYGRSINSPQFQKIKDYKCNRMGWLNDDYINTIIAWHTSRPDIYIWLGDRWKKLTPRSGEYVWQMLKRLSPWIADELRKNHAWYQGGEPLEIADLARQWGYIWSGKVILESLKNYHESTNGEHVTSLHETPSSSGKSETPSAPEPSPQWDVD